ncbi:hypothetical protein HJ207_21870 [Vibrio parahaemolyticus]|nr:hypothetical protein [Vibrio parahaemolyticus]EIU6865418.1 hypothetical protein [Vibrio parahaemolyticus]EIU7066074.1 hypothetical protein [Vibrio parahaemolyticus]MBE3770263.1 hypothetical protein [Vibrio parahaemolyticus]
MEQFISDFLIYVEVAYYLGGIVVAVCAVYATKQISLMKQSITTQSKRESLSLASEKCTAYFNESVPLVNDLYKQFSDNKIEFFNGWQVSVESGKLSVVNGSSRSYTELRNIKFHSYFNSVESVAIFFNSGVADDHVGYNALSYTLLDTLSELMPVIYKLNKQGGYYSNIIELYIRWQTKANHEKLLKDNYELQAKLKVQSPELKEAVGTKIT